MKVLVTGAKGFVGKNLVAQLQNIKDGKARCYGDLAIEAIYEYDIDSTAEELDAYCRDCDFVFNLAGVNRPQNQEEFMQGNFGFASLLLDTLKKHNNTCPVMISSSIQATLAGRFGTSEYGKSKKAGEELMFEYSKETDAKVLVYRFPNLFGKWCRPNYNSAVATFCNNIANDLPIQVNDRSVEMELLYVDDLVDEMIGALKGEEHRCDYVGLTPIPSPKGKGVEASPQPSPKGKGVYTADKTLYSVLKENVQDNRKNQTEAESILWNALRNSNIGYKFRRQHIIKNYIVDFFCNELLLTIEVDGGYHFTLEQREADAVRTRELAELGYAELRFRNEEVINNLDGVIEQIKVAATIRTSTLSGETGTSTLQGGLEGGRGGCAYCYCPTTHKTTLGEIVDLIYSFADQPKTLVVPEIPNNSFAKKLYSTYLSYLPKDKVAFPLKMNVDERGSFTELLKTLNCGQVSINISKPGITKGQHWHNSKWEFFIVVAGHGLIQERKIDSDEVIEFEVSGDKIEAIHMLPGYTHNIINLSQTENLVTVMWANESFDPNKPDTYFEMV